MVVVGSHERVQEFPLSAQKLVTCYASMGYGLSHKMEKTGVLVNQSIVQILYLVASRASFREGGGGGKGRGGMDPKCSPL